MLRGCWSQIGVKGYASRKRFSMRVYAPGKLVILGDYAVLDGSPAMVAAVDRRAQAAVNPSVESSTVVQAVFDTARSMGLSVPSGVEIDTSGFYEAGGEKLGIGSSAAVAVASAALVVRKKDKTCFQLALDGHRRAAGGVGSGIDVAASFYGGVIATHAQPAELSFLPLSIPGFYMSVLYTNQSASTPQLVRACRSASTWDRWMATMRALAERGIASWRDGQGESFLSVVRDYGRAMESLGRDAGVSVVTDTIADIMTYAEAQGAAAKPSGAGGGDVVVVFSKKSELGSELANRTGARLVQMRIDQNGLLLEGC